MRRACLVIAIAMAVFSTYTQAQTGLTAVRYASGFTTPVAIIQDPSNRAIQYVVEQGGTIRVVQNGTVLPTPFLTLTGLSVGGEQGLLGMALAPDYPASGRFYVNFTNAQWHTVIARFRRSSANALVADPASRFDLRWQGAGNPAYITQPDGNHNGGNLAFGPDGFLYIGMGDGGGSGDTANNAQNPAQLLGKMLRVDVSVADNDPIGYRIPPSNPFAGSGSTRNEIWSFGLRNPWRWSFDNPARGGTGALIIGDVGQGAWEEVDYEPAGRGGRNYGWRVREGAHNFNTSLPPAYLPLTEPIYEYNHDVGASITGGVVYRGAAFPALRGRYFFADFIRGWVHSVLITTNGTGEGVATGWIDHTPELGALGNISSFGVDADGEIFIVSYGGTIYRLASAIPSAPRNLRLRRPIR